MKFLRDSSYFSYKNFAANFAIMSIGFIGGANIFAIWVHPLTSQNKLPYFKAYDPDFMFHFNILCAKYGISENIQLN
jgi:hypothetical protein